MTIEEKLNFFVIDIEEVDLPLNFNEIFGDDKPVHLEIGSGKGEFIAKKSAIEKDVNFIGIELKPKRIVTITKKLDPEINKNVRLIKLYVDDKINEFIPQNSFDIIYIQHPDPWPKRRHHKNRLIQNKFLDSLNKILKINGEVQIATDHPEYAKWIQKIFNSRSDFKSIFENGYSMERPPNHISTYFEERWAELGYHPTFMFYRKVGQDEK